MRSSASATPPHLHPGSRCGAVRRCHGAHALYQFIHNARRKGATVILSAVRPETRRALRRGGLLPRDRSVRFAPSLARAWHWSRAERRSRRARTSGRPKLRDTTPGVLFQKRDIGRSLGHTGWTSCRILIAPPLHPECQAFPGLHHGARERGAAFAGNAKFNPGLPAHVQKKVHRDLETAPRVELGAAADARTPRGASNWTILLAVAIGQM
jgi:hypothetical protein